MHLLCISLKKNNNNLLWRERPTWAHISCVTHNRPFIGNQPFISDMVTFWRRYGQTDGHLIKENFSFKTHLKINHTLYVIVIQCSVTYFSVINFRHQTKTNKHFKHNWTHHHVTKCKIKLIILKNTTNRAFLNKQFPVQ